MREDVKRIVKSGDTVTDCTLHISARQVTKICMETCSFIVTDSQTQGFVNNDNSTSEKWTPSQTLLVVCSSDETNGWKSIQETLCNQPDLLKWIKREEEHHSTLMSGCKIEIGESLVLSPFKRSTGIHRRIQNTWWYYRVKRRETKVYKGHYGIWTDWSSWS